MNQKSNHISWSVGRAIFEPVPLVNLRPIKVTVRVRMGLIADGTGNVAIACRPTEAPMGFRLVGLREEMRRENTTVMNEGPREQKVSNSEYTRK